jgi:polyisoprenoid-binding protein YceI
MVHERKGMLLLAVMLLAPSIAARSHPRAETRQPLPVAAADSLWLVTAPGGNSARYRVREQLVGFDLPNDAVGTTGAVTGTIIIGADGKVSPASKFVVDVTPLKSDKERRDGFVQNRLLETAKYPTVNLTITSVDKLHLPLPASGPVMFDLKGDLTVRGMTKPTTWHVTGTTNGTQAAGTAVTAFTFEDFGITKPKVPVVLSVADTIKLEYDFHLIKR